MWLQVDGFTECLLLAKDGLDADSGADGTEGIIWQGISSSHPLDPQLNWAYYNSTDGASYIYDGRNWQILSEDGQDGADGTTAGPAVAWQGSLDREPESPQLNWAYHNSDDRTSYIYDGAMWQMLNQDDSPSGAETGFDAFATFTVEHYPSPPLSGLPPHAYIHAQVVDIDSIANANPGPANDAISDVIFEVRAPDGTLIRREFITIGETDTEGQFFSTSQPAVGGYFYTPGVTATLTFTDWWRSNGDVSGTEVRITKIY